MLDCLSYRHKKNTLLKLFLLIFFRNADAIREETLRTGSIPAVTTFRQRIFSPHSNFQGVIITPLVGLI